MANMCGAQPVQLSRQLRHAGLRRARQACLGADPSLRLGHGSRPDVSAAARSSGHAAGGPRVRRGRAGAAGPINPGKLLYFSLSALTV
jgi:hypothetical protein